MDSIFDDLDEQHIAPQKFTQGIAACVAVIALSYAHIFLWQTATSVINMLIIAVTIYVQVFFRNYLRNFSAWMAVSWVKWQIRLTTLSLVLALISYLEPVNALSLIISRVSYYNLMPVLIVILLAISIYVDIRAGIALQKIDNDFIGLLRPLGIFMASAIPAVTVFSFLFAYFGARYTFPYSIRALQLLETTVDLVPMVLLALIFSRAMKWVGK